MKMSATGGSPATDVLRPVGASVVGRGVVLARTACSTGVIDCVVNTHDSTMSWRAMPRDTAALSCEFVSRRNGSSAQAFAVGISGSVDAPLTHSGDVRVARKYVVSGVASLPAP